MVDETEEGIQIGSRKINNLRHADDVTLVDDTEKDLQHQVEKVKIASEKAGLYLNIKKTKVLPTAPCNSLTINGENIEVVKALCYWVQL